MDALVAQLAAGRDLTATWLVVDMDAFFASVEELHDPSLVRSTTYCLLNGCLSPAYCTGQGNTGSLKRLPLQSPVNKALSSSVLMPCKCILLQKEKPMAVGGIGMISTANYVARRYGVRSAMPGFIGRRLCPELVFARPGETLVAALLYLLMFHLSSQSAMPSLLGRRLWLELGFVRPGEHLDDFLEISLSGQMHPLVCAVTPISAAFRVHGSRGTRRHLDSHCRQL